MSAALLPRRSIAAAPVKVQRASVVFWNTKFRGRSPSPGIHAGVPCASGASFKGTWKHSVHCRNKATQPHVASRHQRKQTPPPIKPNANLRDYPTRTARTHTQTQKPCRRHTHTYVHKATYLPRVRPFACPPSAPPASPYCTRPHPSHPRSPRAMPPPPPPPPPITPTSPECSWAPAA